MAAVKAAGRGGLSAEEISSAAEFVHTARIQLSCSICKDVLEVPMMLKDCMHYFCSSCIRMWLLESSKCPSCATEVRSTASLVSLRPLVPLLQLWRRNRDELTTVAVAAVKNAKCCECGASVGANEDPRGHVRSCVRQVQDQGMALADDQLEKVPPPDVPRVFFKGKKDREVRDVLGSLQLRTNGNREALERRYRHYALQLQVAADMYRQIGVRPSVAAIRERLDRLEAKRTEMERSVRKLSTRKGGDGIGSFFAGPAQAVATDDKVFGVLLAQARESYVRRSKKATSGVENHPSALPSLHPEKPGGPGNPEEAEDSSEVASEIVGRSGSVQAYGQNHMPRPPVEMVESVEDDLDAAMLDGTCDLPSLAGRKPGAEESPQGTEPSKSRTSDGTVEKKRPTVRGGGPEAADLSDRQIHVTAPSNLDSVSNDQTEQATAVSGASDALDGKNIVRKAGVKRAHPDVPTVADDYGDRDRDRDRDNISTVVESTKANPSTQAGGPPRTEAREASACSPEMMRQIEQRREAAQERLRRRNTRHRLDQTMHRPA